MQDQVQSPASFMRLLKYCFLISALLFIYVASKIPADPGPSVSQSFSLVICIIGLLDVYLGFYLPRIMFRNAETKPQNRPLPTPLNRWLSKGIVSLAFFESSILFGLVLHFLGAPLKYSALLFGAGIAAMLFWSPGDPPDSAEGASGEER